MSHEDIESEGQLIPKEVYPDPAAVFSTRPKPLEEIKGDCLVVLDTNVLLVPYTISPKNLGEIEKTYQRLVNEGRLRIPAQVAREFAKNRAKKLGELFQQLSSKKSDIKFLQTGRYPSLESVPEYAEVVELERNIDSELKKYRDAISKVIERVKQWNWDDPVSLLYSRLFTSEVISEPTLSDADLLKDLARRTEHKLPPGYKDAGKKSNAAGDLVIWHTILHAARTQQRSVIFVSGDGKPDWWHKGAGLPLYPRFELVEEFRRESGGHSIHIMKFSDFLDLFGVEKTVVQQVRDKEVPNFSFATPGDARNFGARAETAVRRWLSLVYPEAEIEFDPDGELDFLFTRPDGRRCGTVVRFVRDPKFNLTRRVREGAYIASHNIANGRIKDFLLCIVAADSGAVMEFEGLFERVRPKPPFVEIVFGYLDDSGDYKVQMEWDVGRSGPGT